jgi:hypothetical protein
MITPFFRFYTICLLIKHKAFAFHTRFVLPLYYQVKKQTVKVMKKNLSRFLIFASLLSIGLAATSCDAPSKDETITEVVDVVAFKEYPYADVTQGQLIPNTTSPFVLYVKPTGEEGVKTLKTMMNFSNAYVTEIHEIGDGGYLVSTKMYFEGPQYFYVSNSYQTSKTANPLTHPIFILPKITIKMKDGKNIATVAEKYKDYLTHNENYDLLEKSGMYVFDCNLSNSYDVLVLASIVSQLDDVAWAEADSTGSHIY